MSIGGQGSGPRGVIIGRAFALPLAWPGPISRIMARCAPCIDHVIVGIWPGRYFGCRMNLRVRENPWRLMLAVNVAVLIGVFLYKITLPSYVPYIHLLVDYHFGFTKRAPIGALVGLFFS